jgi:DNA-binding NtrC family response regulator
VGATNREGDHRGIRPDLRHRLGDPILIPPLRRRKEDIPALVGHFLPHEHRLTISALQALMLYAWPGNVRELENAIVRAVLLAGDRKVIDFGHLPAPIAGQLSRSDDSDPATEVPAQAIARDVKEAPVSAARKPRARVSREELIQLLLDHKGRIADVAKVLDRRWQVVWKWLKSDGIDPNDFREPGRRKDDLPA